MGLWVKIDQAYLSTLFSNGCGKVNSGGSLTNTTFLIDNCKDRIVQHSFAVREGLFS